MTGIRLRWDVAVGAVQIKGTSSPDSYRSELAANPQASRFGYSLLTVITLLITVVALDDVFVVCAFTSER